MGEERRGERERERVGRNGKGTERRRARERGQERGQERERGREWERDPQREGGEFELTRMYGTPWQHRAV